MFLIGMSRLVENKFCTTTLLKDMDIARLMVYAQQIEESNLRQRNMDGKGHMINEQSQPKPKKRFYHKETFMGKKDKVSNQNSQECCHAFQRYRCATCGKQHLGKCLSNTDGFLCGGNSGHKMRDFPNLKAKEKTVNQYPQGGLDPNAPKKNCFYALGSRGEY